MNRQKRTAIILIGLLLSVPSFAAVYMEKDADGNVVFTDRPSSEKAKQVELSPTSTYSSPNAGNAPPPANAKREPQEQNYEYLTITHPGDDMPLRSNNGTLEVSVELSPSLMANHRFVLMMDGNLADEGQSSILIVQNVDRGTHTIQVQIVDEAGNALISSNTITFHMLRI